MNFSIGSDDSGTAQQRAWAQEAIQRCKYPLDALPVDVRVVWAPISALAGHSYMRTEMFTDGSATITIEPWADDPNDIRNRGLPNPGQDIKEFYMQSFVHELGHVTHFTLINTDDLRTQAAGLFWQPDVNSGTGRRTGLLSDYSHNEVTGLSWAESIIEAVAESYKCAFYVGRLIYMNRTLWRIDEPEWPTLLRLLSVGGESGPGLVDRFTASGLGNDPLMKGMVEAAWVPSSYVPGMAKLFGPRIFPTDPENLSVYSGQWQPPQDEWFNEGGGHLTTLLTFTDTDPGVPTHSFPGHWIYCDLVPNLTPPDHYSAPHGKATIGVADVTSNGIRGASVGLFVAQDPQTALSSWGGVGVSDDGTYSMSIGSSGLGRSGSGLTFPCFLSVEVDSEAGTVTVNITRDLAGTVVIDSLSGSPDMPPGAVPLLPTIGFHWSAFGQSADVSSPQGFVNLNYFAWTGGEPPTPVSAPYPFTTQQGLLNVGAGAYGTLRVS